MNSEFSSDRSLEVTDATCRLAVGKAVFLLLVTATLCVQAAYATQRQGAAVSTASASTGAMTWQSWPAPTEPLSGAETELQSNLIRHVEMTRGRTLRAQPSRPHRSGSRRPSTRPMTPRYLQAWSDWLDTAPRGIRRPKRGTGTPSGTGPQSTSRNPRCSMRSTAPSHSHPTTRSSRKHGGSWPARGTL